MAHYMSRTPFPTETAYSPDNEGNQATSILAGFIEVAERQSISSLAGPLFMPLPHKSDRESMSDMDIQEERGETPTMDERTDTASEARSTGKGPRRKER